MHTIVRVSEEAEKDLSMEERLRLVEGELARMRQTFERLVERGGNVSVPGSFPAA